MSDEDAQGHVIDLLQQQMTALSALADAHDRDDDVRFLEAEAEYRDLEHQIRDQLDSLPMDHPIRQNPVASSFARAIADKSRALGDRIRRRREALAESFEAQERTRDAVKAYAQG